MSTTNKPARRGFLALLTGAAAAPIATALPAAAATVASPAPVEAPELLAIGERLPDLAARFRAAWDRLNEATATYDRLKPAIPPEIIAPHQTNLTEIERGLDREPIQHRDGGRNFFRGLFSSRKVKMWILEIEAPRNTKEGRRLRRIARLATKYERDRQAAIDASGYRAASWALGRLHGEMQDDFAKAALNIKPRTMQGVAVYAAIIALGNGPGKLKEGQPCYGCEPLAIATAEAFIAINGGGAT